MSESSRANSIKLESSLQNYFFDELNSINKKSSHPLPQETVFYSSLVLDSYGQSEKFFEKDEEGRVTEKILGLKLLESQHLPNAQKKQVLKDIGDTALILCGYFSDSISKKMNGEKYYLELGQIAYRRLNSIVPEAFHVPCFFEGLSSSLCDTVNLISIFAQKNELKAFPLGVSFIIKSDKIKAS